MKKAVKLKLCSILLILLAPLTVLFLFLGMLSGDSETSASDKAFAYYVDHWTTDDPYTHNLLAHRYGITASQLDGFLDSTGIKYDKSRINGTKLLEWEKKSGLDVRAIVAIAQMESSLGTAGVATHKGANMFGYGAFDGAESNATNYSDEIAVVGLTNVTIIQNQNETFKRQDDKAKLHAQGKLDTSKDGGVYFTSTDGTGKKRAEVMAKLDEWIDAHGGTPKAPTNTNSNGTTELNVPAGFTLSKPMSTAGYTSATYPYGQCTWFVFNRAKQFGISFSAYMGNGGDWKYQSGYEVTNTPKAYSALCFSPGQAGADSTYGHIAFVEQVRSDGSVLISESNAQGLGVVSYRVFDKATASQFSYVIGK